MWEPSLRQGGGDGLLEEQPNVPAIARARSLQSGRHVHAAARIQDGPRIFPPMRLVEIGSQEEAGLVLQHGVDAHHEITARIISAGKVPADGIVGDGQEVALRAVGALDLGLLAHARNPLVGARRLIAALAGLAALEAARIDIVPSAKEPRNRATLDSGEDS